MMKTYDYYRNEQRYHPEPVVDVAALEILAGLTNDERAAIVRGQAQLTYPKFQSLSTEHRILTVSRVKQAILRIPFTPVTGGDDEWTWNPVTKCYVNRRHMALRKYADGTTQLHIARLHAYTDDGTTCVVDSYVDVVFPMAIDRRYPMNIWFNDTTYARPIQKPTTNIRPPRQPATLAALTHEKHRLPTRFYIPAYEWDFATLDWRSTPYVVEREPNKYVDYHAIYYVPQGDGVITLVGEWFAEDYAREVRAALTRLNIS